MTTARTPRLIDGDIVLDLPSHTVRVAGEAVHLTRIEFRLLRWFMINAGRVGGREQLLDEVWGFDATGSDRTVDVHIRRLRMKVPQAKITTVGMGAEWRSVLAVGG